jgi:ABC-type multidrug transport system fused ATPase/permease subunit
VIAHRLSTVKRADITTVLESGRVGESGNHDEFMDLEGMYCAMLHRQQVEGAH